MNRYNLNDRETSPDLKTESNNTIFKGFVWDQIYFLNQFLKVIFFNSPFLKNLYFSLEIELYIPRLYHITSYLCATLKCLIFTKTINYSNYSDPMGSY